MLLAFLSALILCSPADTMLVPGYVIALKERTPLEKTAAPVSILQEAEVKKGGITCQERLSALVPGLLIPDYGASMTSTIYLRGIGSRMENPSVALYVDGIPIIDKNAYDTDWTGVSFAALSRGPGGTLYGRNSMSGTLVLQSLSPDGQKQLEAFAEGGLPLSLRAGLTASSGQHAFSAAVKLHGGWFNNEYKDAPCDPYQGLSVRWKWEQGASSLLRWSNSLFATVSREGGFAYGRYEGGVLGPVSYNDEGSYGRLSVIEGLRFRLREESFTLEGTASLQWILDDMHMDQDFTPQSVFTLQQRRQAGTGTLELIARGGNGNWRHTTGLFALGRGEQMHAPVNFGRDGIQTLILDNANRNIPESIGYLSIPDEHFPVLSDFVTGTWDAALFHESVFSLGRWMLTGGLRIDWEGGRMSYDCHSQLHFRFVPTMKADKALDVPYRGSVSRSSGLQLLPKLSALFEVSEGLYGFACTAKGYRAGGFNTQIFSDILQNRTMLALMRDLGVYPDLPAGAVTPENTRYKSESAWNYEAGARLIRDGFRAELSLYRMDIRDQQLTVFPPGQSTGRMMTNAGRSRSIGAEAEATWQKGEFRLRSSYAWCDARFISYNDGRGDYSGQWVPYVPEHTVFLSVGWSHPVKDATLHLGASCRAYGPICWDETGTLQEPVHIRPDARIALAFDKWEIWLRGENLTGSSGRNFYFKSVSREFFSLERPRSILTGISINL